LYEPTDRPVVAELPAIVTVVDADPDVAVETPAESARLKKFNGPTVMLTKPLGILGVELEVTDTVSVIELPMII
jgi:hypothetical protein